MSTVEYRLRRPNSDTAWGFRLQGGLDVNAPLTVQRVFNASPADGSLQRGDVMLSINDSDVSAVYLKRAEELIKASSNTLQVVVRRIGEPVNSSRPQNDLFIQQQNAVYRPIDSSPVPPKYDNPHHHHQPSTLQQQGPSRPPQSNVWRPPVHSTSTPYDVGSTSIGDGHDGHHAGMGHSGGQLRGSRPALHDKVLEDLSLSVEPATVQRGTSDASPSYARQQQQQPSSASLPIGTASRPQPTDDDEDEYEPKSVCDIKQMFNSMSKTSPRGPVKAANKPNVPQKTFHGSGDISTSGNAAHPSAGPAAFSARLSVSQTAPAKSLASPPQQSPSKYYDDLYGDYPPPRQDPLANKNNSMMKVSTAVKPLTSQPKPGAGYSYQGIVTVTPAKTVNKAGPAASSGGGKTQGNKKKEFDPSQSLVFLALQEENERAKRGEVTSPDDEEPPRAKQQAPAPARGGQRQRANNNAKPAAWTQPEQQQRSSRLQELLDRDQAHALQAEDESPGSGLRSSSSPHVLTMQTRREQSPSYPGYDNQQPSHWKQPQQVRAPHQPVASYQHQQHQQQRQHHQSSVSPSNGYQQHQYHGGYDRSAYGGANYSQDLRVTDF